MKFDTTAGAGASNIIQFPTTRITTATRNECLASRVVRNKVSPVMPSWVIADKELNKLVMLLLDGGWEVYPYAKNYVVARHPGEYEGGWVTEEAAFMRECARMMAEVRQ